MACEDCERWAGAPGWWRRCDPACLRCGGRWLWLNQKQRLRGETDAQKAERLRAALEVWTALGHDEQQLRELAQLDWKKGG